MALVHTHRASSCHYQEDIVSVYPTLILETRHVLQVTCTLESSKENSWFSYLGVLKPPAAKLHSSGQLYGVRHLSFNGLATFNTDRYWYWESDDDKNWYKRCVAVRAHKIAPVCGQNIVKICFPRESRTSRSNTMEFQEWKSCWMSLLWRLNQQVACILNFWNTFWIPNANLQLLQIKGASGSVKLSFQKRHYRELLAHGCWRGTAG